MITIRIDDVLQSRLFSASQQKAIDAISMFNWFKLATRTLDEVPLILAVIAEGIDSQPEWVEYIKAHPEWKVQCHGWEHKLYSKLPKEEITQELRRAKDKIEETFGQEVTRYYPPKMKYNDVSREAALDAGLVETRERWTLKHYLDGDSPKDIDEAYVHYWSLGDVVRLNKHGEYK